MLSQFGREQQAIAAYEDLLSRFGDANEQVLLEQVADALLGKGLSLLQLSDFEQAIAVCDDLLNRFGEALDQTLREVAAKALSNKGWALAQLAQRELSLGHFKSGRDYYRAASTFSEADNIAGLDWRKHNANIAIVRYFLKFYGLHHEEDNPSSGYDLPKRVITEAELREYIKEQAALLTERLGLPEEAPFPILNERTVKAIIAHGKKHAWDERRKRGWPYHTNAFVYVHITYRRWVNRGLTREILSWADGPLYAHLNKKISLEGLPGWLDLPSGPEARARHHRPDKTIRIGNLSQDTTRDTASPCCSQIFGRIVLHDHLLTFTVYDNRLLPFGGEAPSLVGWRYRKLARDR